jgi:hypothetical protein
MKITPACIGFVFTENQPIYSSLYTYIMNDMHSITLKRRDATVTQPITL